ncbi:MAG: winged helix-turn-helix domain-containing protein [Deltaproteobacteria bacterium]|nr:winged helix-turn-helix domain-containing protein [Deltaproteobacteria bacterium]
MGEQYLIGDLTVDTGNNTVTRGNEAITLSPRSFQLLVALARRAPNVVSRQELLETVWPDEYVNDETLSQRVRVLRKSLGDLEETPRYISAVRGWGYCVVLPVECVEIPKGKIRSIAVLPLTNITGDPQLEYFADGMTDALISALAKIRTLKVISRTSVMNYKKTNKKAPQIARELGVEAIIEGTVLVTKERVRVSAQLVHGATDDHFWAETYDRDLGDVLAMHSEIAQAIAHEIRAVITPEDSERLEQKHRIAPDLLEAYLKGQYFLFKYTPEDVRRGISFLEQAVAGDPLFAEAHAVLAHAYLTGGLPTGNNLSVMKQRQLLAMARRSAEKALDIDLRIALAHGVKAMIYLFHDWDWERAEQALERAGHFEPNNALVHIYRAGVAATKLESEKTLEELRSVISLDPVNLAFLSAAEEICWWIRDYSQAIAYATQVLDLDPGYQRAHFVLARVYEAQGRFKEMITEYENSGFFTDNGAKEARCALKEGGAPGYYRWAIEVQFGAMGDSPVDGVKRPLCEDKRAIFRARNYAKSGDADNAIKCLEQSYKERDGLMVLLKAWEWFDSIRSDARFQDLVWRVGIP